VGIEWSTWRDKPIAAPFRDTLKIGTSAECSAFTPEHSSKGVLVALETLKCLDKSVRGRSIYGVTRVRSVDDDGSDAGLLFDSHAR
jgi:hypothetical protein